MGTNPTILVTGASGQVGRGVVEELAAVGADVRAAGRQPEKLRPPAGVPTVAADLTRPETLPAALDGVGKVFLYAVPDGVSGFLDAARTAGVEHVVLLSSHTVMEDIPEREPISRMHRVVEEAIVDSGIPYTFLRPDNFATNLLMWGWPESIRADGVVRFPYPESHSDAIHERDLAEVAAKVLTEPGHEGRSYHLTGAESITQRRQAELIGAAIGKPVRFDEMTPEQAWDTLGKIIPSWVLGATIGYWKASDGIPVTITDTVEKLTGKPARTFAQWAHDHAADFTA